MPGKAHHLFWHCPRNQVPWSLLASRQAVQDGLARDLPLEAHLGGKQDSAEEEAGPRYRAHSHINILLVRWLSELFPPQVRLNPLTDSSISNGSFITLPCGYPNTVITRLSANIFLAQKANTALQEGLHEWCACAHIKTQDAQVALYRIVQIRNDSSVW